MRQSDEGIIMEGWLYLIRSNTIGFKYSRKLYYVLQNHRFNSFSSISDSYNKDPIRSTVVDSSIHVMDNGRKCIRGKVFFVFTLCDTSSYSAHVKLGASNPEEAAKWIKSFQELSKKVKRNPGIYLDCIRSNCSGRVFDKNDVDDIISLTSIMDPGTADMYDPSYWTIFGCHYGIRLFKQARYREGHNKRDRHPALAAVSVIEEAPEVIFQTLMSLGFSRSQWDFCFQKGSVIENIDDHTDIIHKQSSGDWLPWSMKQRDLLLQRYWRREDNGTYIILYHSVFNNKCPPQKGFIRARLKCGGYVISPGNQYKQSVVRHMLAIDWKSWRHNLHKSSDQCLTIHMLERLAALREHFKTNLASYLLSEFSSQELKTDSLLHKKENDQSNLVKTDDESDEFFDFSEPLFDDGSENSWTADNNPGIYTQDVYVKAEKKHEFVCDQFTLHTRSIYAEVHKKGCQDLETILWDQCVSYNYTITLPEDQTGNLPHSWSTPEPSLFQLRGETFLDDHKKITAESTLMQTVAVDWLKSDKREDHLANRPGNIVQKYTADGRPEFFIIVNFQIPGSTNYNLVFYYTTRTPIKDIPLLERFIEGDDAFRNSRLKLIPHVSKGPWILRHTIRLPALIGNLLKINYIHGKNYLEMDVDVGSSACARGVAGKTFSCFSNLIMEIAFVIQATTRDELPEHLLGACRLSNLDVSKAVWANP
ncbi:hypothetical protein L1987_34677 [Smallanthus sonchifolius]|uniref:Uncharacterized protein n=1 Tax=Smallanthus sonchifolius TaxID=185202 RepID=A0ACB9HUG8_9ASTR|nr:hypothetical protein L1987_34677 [Smallanthus sonchifolius]